MVECLVSRRNREAVRSAQECSQPRTSRMRSAQPSSSTFAITRFVPGPGFCGACFDHRLSRPCFVARSVSICPPIWSETIWPTRRCSNLTDRSFWDRPCIALCRLYVDRRDSSEPRLLLYGQRFLSSVRQPEGDRETTRFPGAALDGDPDGSGVRAGVSASECQRQFQHYSGNRRGDGSSLPDPLVLVAHQRHE